MLLLGPGSWAPPLTCTACCCCWVLAHGVHPSPVWPVAAAGSWLMGCTPHLHGLLLLLGPGSWGPPLTCKACCCCLVLAHGVHPSPVRPVAAAGSWLMGSTPHLYGLDSTTTVHHTALTQPAPLHACYSPPPCYSLPPCSMQPYCSPHSLPPCRMQPSTLLLSHEICLCIHS